jgi:hypothetical protein
MRRFLLTKKNVMLLTNTKYSKCAMKYWQGSDVKSVYLKLFLVPLGV